MFSQFLQLTLAGVAQGCVYALVALGFVLIYKATETVNFAQGDLMMLGAFFGLTASTILGWPYWATILFAIVVMAAVGMSIERIVIRPVLGYPTFTVVMITIGVGYVLRGVVTMVPGWGTETYSLPTPFGDGVIRFGGAVLAVEQLATIALTAALCLVLYLFFRFAKLGVAMQATSQNQLAAYYMGIPVQRVNMLIWGLAAAVAAFGGILLAPVAFVHSNMGFIGLKAFPAAVVGGFGSVPGAIVGGLIIGVVEALAGFYLPEGFKDVAAYVVVLVVLLVHAVRDFRRNRAEEGVNAPMRFIFKTDYAQDIRLFQHGGQMFWYGAARRAAARRAVSGQRLRAVATPLHLHLLDRRLRADAAGRLHRADLARPRRVPRGRRLHRGAAAGGRHAVRRLDRLRGAVLGRGRHHRRPAGAAPEGHLPRDRDLRVQRDRRGDHHALGASLTGGNSGKLLKADRHVRLPAQQRRELLLSLPRAHRAVLPRADQPAALADRPRLRRDPRLRKSRRAAWASISPATRRCRSRSRRRSPASAARSMRTRSASSRPSSSR